MLRSPNSGEGEVEGGRYVLVAPVVAVGNAMRRGLNARRGITTTLALVLVALILWSGGGYAASEDADHGSHYSEVLLKSDEDYGGESTFGLGGIKNFFNDAIGSVTSGKIGLEPLTEDTSTSEDINQRAENDRQQSQDVNPAQKISLGNQNSNDDTSRNAETPQSGGSKAGNRLDPTQQVVLNPEDNTVGRNQKPLQNSIGDNQQQSVPTGNNNSSSTPSRTRPQQQLPSRQQQRPSSSSEIPTLPTDDDQREAPSSSGNLPTQEDDTSPTQKAQQKPSVQSPTEQVQKQQETQTEPEDAQRLSRPQYKTQDSAGSAQQKGTPEPKSGTKSFARGPVAITAAVCSVGAIATGVGFYLLKRRNVIGPSTKFKERLKGGTGMPPWKDDVYIDPTTGEAFPALDTTGTKHSAATARPGYATFDSIDTFTNDYVRDSVAYPSYGKPAYVAQPPLAGQQPSQQYYPPPGFVTPNQTWASGNPELTGGSNNGDPMYSQQRQNYLPDARSGSQRSFDNQR